MAPSDISGVFAEIRKTTINFVMSVCPSARNDSPPRTDFGKF